eukprot:12415179-Karenia_brevis.AAC.1
MATPEVAARLANDTFRLLSRKQLAQLSGRGGTADFVAPEEELLADVMKELKGMVGLSEEVCVRVEARLKERKVHDNFSMEGLLE